MTGKDTSLIGREGELSRLRELAAPPYAESRALLLGDSGVGKLSVPGREVLTGDDHVPGGPAGSGVARG